MKTKLIQILLGAIGSAITVLISHYAAPGADATVAALAAGPATTYVVGAVTALREGFGG